MSNLDKEIDALFDDTFERGQDIVLVHNFENGRENYKQYRARATKELKSLIADHEKQMLEFVIGEDIPPGGYGTQEHVEKMVQTPWWRTENQLKARQRQRAAELGIKL